MLKLFPSVAACAVLATASAQTIYKCTGDGRVAYGDQPCTTGVTHELAVAAAPAPDPQTAARLARQKALADHLTASEQRAELAAQREQQRARRVAASQKRKCDRLRLRHQWAQEDARRAGEKASAAANFKARRQAESLALECPS